MLIKCLWVSSEIFKFVESELGISVSAGFNYSIDWDDSRALELSIWRLAIDATTFQNKHEGYLQEELHC